MPFGEDPVVAEKKQKEVADAVVEALAEAKRASHIRPWDERKRPVCEFLAFFPGLLHYALGDFTNFDIYMYVHIKIRTYVCRRSWPSCVGLEV